MKPIKDLTNEIRLQDEPDYTQTAEMYFSVKNVDPETGEVDENKSTLTIRELIRPLVKSADPVQMMILEKAAEKSGHSTLLAHIRFEN